MRQVPPAAVAPIAHRIVPPKHRPKARRVMVRRVMARRVMVRLLAAERARGLDALAAVVVDAVVNRD